jgi:hypothetical protein
MDLHTAEIVFKMTLDLALGICIKLLCDNGRIHYQDLVNDLFFWVPGVQVRECDGLGHQVAAMAVAVPVETEQTLPLAAK